MPPAYQASNQSQAPDDHVTQIGNTMESLRLREDEPEEEEQGNEQTQDEPPNPDGMYVTQCIEVI